MASSGKKKTTMAKLARESKLRERRLQKQAKKDARKYALPEPAGEHGDELMAADTEPAAQGAEHVALAAVGQALADV